MDKNNWNTKKLYELGTFDKGAGISKEDILPQGLPCIRYAEIYTKYDFQAKEFSSYISAETAKTSKPITQGTLLFAGSGETAEDIGKSVAYMGNSIAYASGDTILFKFHNSKENILFYSYYLNTVGRKQLNKLGAGQSIVHIYPKELAKVLVPCPPIEEQRKIVEVLKTWDNAIGLTKQLIEQKELQKKYLMQQLLTGRTRLKGFNGRWENAKLGTILEEVSKRNTKRTITQVLSVTNNRGFVRPEEHFAKNVASENLSNYKIINRGEFAYNPSRINVGSIAFLEAFEQGVLSPMYVVFKCFPCIASTYFKHWIKTKEFNKRVSSAAQGSVRSTVDFSSLSTIKIHYPTDLQEQQAIAGIISFADKEIYLLKQKLAKLEEQKKGLMQVLLTGKVRLVK